MDERRWEGESVIMDYNGKRIRVIGLRLSDERSRVLSPKINHKSRILKEDYGRFSSTSSLFSFPLSLGVRGYLPMVISL